MFSRSNSQNSSLGSESRPHSPENKLVNRSRSDSESHSHSPSKIERHVEAGRAKDRLKKATTLTAAMERELDDIASSSTQNLSATDDKTLCRQLKQKVAVRYNISEKEQDALDRYQGGEYKKLNEALRGSNRAEQYRQSELTTDLASALEKLPKHEGLTYRTVSFKTAEEYNEFVKKFVEKETTYTTPQFDSTTRTAGGNVNLTERPFTLNMRIEANGFGSDIASVISTFPDRENEVVFPPGTIYSFEQQPPLAKPGAAGINGQVEMKAAGVDENVLKKAIAKPSPRELFGV